MMTRYKKTHPETKVGEFQRLFKKDGKTYTIYTDGSEIVECDTDDPEIITWLKNNNYQVDA